VYPNVFMTADDTEKLTTIQTDLISYINSSRSNFVMNGLTDADWDEYLKQVNAYGLDEYLSIYQKYFDEFYK
ncbi:MAG: ABC transporter substrate-binding protein, partial [Butyrivibrio sp.]|nr:ABC transporter substrate-binding protein [Butyrivibrio sp.]